MQRWWLSNTPSGSFKIIRMQQELSCSPGRLISIEKTPTCDEIDLEWITDPRSRIVYFRINSWNTLDLNAGTRTETNNVAGLAQFQASLDEQRVIAFMPKQVDHDQLLSLIPSQDLTINLRDINSLSWCATEDSYSAAKEIVRTFPQALSLWNDIGKSTFLIPSVEASFPTPIEIGGKIFTKTCVVQSKSCKPTFVNELVQKSRWLGKEAIRSHSDDLYRTNFAIKPSLSRRVFSALSSLRQKKPNIHDIQSTVNALNEESHYIHVEGATEQHEFEVITCKQQKPHKVTSTRTIRSTISINASIELVTGIVIASTWILWPESVFENQELLLKETNDFIDSVNDKIMDFRSQYLSTIPLSYGAHLLIQSAFKVCKPEGKDTLSAEDLMRLVEVNDPDNQLSNASKTTNLMNLMENMDPDHSGFVEFNEFWLHCHQFNMDQLHRLATLSGSIDILIKGHWSPALFDLDASAGLMHLYLDKKAHQLALPTRMSLPHNAKDKLGPLSIMEIEVGTGNRLRLFTSIGDVELKAPSSIFKTLLKLLKQSTLLHAIHSAQPIEISSSIISELAITAAFSAMS